ncbi:MAG: SRPBCC family protein [Nannocystaceae bacterium]
MKKIFLWTVAAAAMFAALLIVPGLLIPAEHVSMRSIHLEASPSEVWAALTEFEQLPTWRSGIKRVEVERSGEQMQIIERGEDRAMTFNVIAFEPNSLLKTEIADPDLPFSGTWTWELQPHGKGCTLTITENGRVKSPAMRTVTAVFMDPADTQDQYLRELADHFDDDAVPGPG